MPRYSVDISTEATDEVQTVFLFHCDTSLQEFSENTSCLSGGLIVLG